MLSKCKKCGNELGKTMVYPFPVSYMDMKTKQIVELVYMAGFSQNGLCWFCQFPNVGPSNWKV